MILFNLDEEPRGSGQAETHGARASLREEFMAEYYSVVTAERALHAYIQQAALAARASVSLAFLLESQRIRTAAGIELLERRAECLPFPAQFDRWVPDDAQRPELGLAEEIEQQPMLRRLLVKHTDLVVTLQLLAVRGDEGRRRETLLGSLVENHRAMARSAVRLLPRAFAVAPDCDDATARIKREIRAKFRLDGRRRADGERE